MENIKVPRWRYPSGKTKIELLFGYVNSNTAWSCRLVLSSTHEFTLVLTSVFISLVFSATYFWSAVFWPLFTEAFINWSIGSSVWTWGRISSLWGWRSTGPGCPGRLWSLLLWRYSRPAWTRSCAACFWWPCFCRGVGLGDPQRSLPTPAILWFCDSVRCAFTVALSASSIWNFPGVCTSIYFTGVSRLSRDFKHACVEQQ